jgi:CBS-domain-containing membrane protein
MGALPGRLGTLQARNIMTGKIVVLSENDTLERAVEVLTEQQISGAPVVDEIGVFRGLISLTDIAHGRAQAPEDEFAEAPRLVRDCMSDRIVSVRDSASLLEVARKMCAGHWHRLTVVDDQNCICGIVSTMDVLAAVVNTADETH